MSSHLGRSGSAHASYPRPANPTSSKPVVPPPPFIPYSPPPPTLSPPILPQRPSTPPLPDGWLRTTHIVPAAYPRRFPDSQGSLRRESSPFQLESPKESETREERLARNEGEARECVRRRFDAVEFGSEEAHRLGEGKEGLYMAAERWVRDGGLQKGEEGVTLVVTHANGFHKESWHPTLRRLLDSSSFNPSDNFGDGSSSQTDGTTPSPSVSTALRIDEVWLFDDVHHAASIDLNAGRIGGVHGWSDGGRDIVNFLQHIYKGPSGEYVDQEILGWENVTKSRRKVIGVGHSVGGNALVQAAAEAPSLFHALFLVEPMCPLHHPPRSTLQLNENFGRYWYLVLGAAKRRTEWPTLAEAAKVRSAPFFASWHEEVWALYMEHGLVPVPGTSGGEAVQLATPSWAEGCVFGEPTGIAEGWDRLAQLDIPVGFLMAGENRATQGEKMTGEMVWRAKRSSNERVMDGGHLLVHEKPDEVADALHRFIGSLSAEFTGAPDANQPRARL